MGLAVIAPIMTENAEYALNALRFTKNQKLPKKIPNLFSDDYKLFRH